MQRVGQKRVAVPNDSLAPETLMWVVGSEKISVAFGGTRVVMGRGGLVCMIP